MRMIGKKLVGTGESVDSLLGEARELRAFYTLWMRATRERSDARLVGEPISRETVQRIWTLFDTADAQAHLEAVVRELRNLPVRFDVNTSMLQFREGLDEPEKVEVKVPERPDSETVYRGLDLVRRRLTEGSPVAAARIEQLLAEADFRSAVAVPLLVISVVMAVDAATWWILAAVLPIALLVQSRHLTSRANSELIDVMRARAGTDELLKLTGVLDAYEKATNTLARDLTRAGEACGKKEGNERSAEISSTEGSLAKPEHADAQR